MANAKVTKVTECNNEGALVFSYDLEDIDHLESGADVYNGQESVLWQNLRATRFDEMKAMYQNLRSTGALSYEKVKKAFEDHQAKWPEAIFNEDAWFKYLAPLVEKGNASYLSMLQGSKAEQRKWWLYNRFRYIDSKYNAGDALTNVITVRAYAKSNITLVPFASIYASVKFGSYLVSKRASRNQTTTIVCPVDALNDSEVYIYSCDQLASVGDLSGLKVGYADFSRAIKLQDLKIGDADANYSNGNLTELYLGNNTLLQTIDVRNCPNLTQAVNLSGCTGIEEVYFDGTAITSLSLPNGGVLKKLHLPGTVTNLTVRNQTSLSEFVMPSYSNITTLWLENNGGVIPMMDILDVTPANSRVRLIGINLEAEDGNEIKEFYDKLDLMRGLDESGNNMEHAQVSGRIHVPALTGAEMASFRARYPSVTIAADHTTSYLYYYNEDGSALLTFSGKANPEPVYDGGNGTYTNATTKADSADGHYSYTADGWATTPGGAKDANALIGVDSDRNVYAAYASIVKTYTVTWKNGSTTIRTDSNVPWGTKVTWGQAMPTNSSGQTATGWDYDLTKPITGNTTISAAYKPLYTITFVRGSADGGGTLQTLKVEEGNMPVYSGATPTSTQGSAEDYPFEGWVPTIVAATANTTYTAKFGSPIDVSEISDSWDTIIANIDNGTYSTKYKIGNYKPLDLGETYGTVNMQIVAFDTDILSGQPLEVEGTTKAPITFIGMNAFCYPRSYSFNKTLVDNGDGTYQDATGAIGGYEHSNLKTVLETIVVPSIPNNVKSRIVSVIKSHPARDTSGASVSQRLNLKIWAPSYHEIAGFESVVNYQNFFKDNESRIVYQTSEMGNSIANPWLRSTFGLDKANVVGFNGTVGSEKTYITKNVYFGFCLGLEEETITDDWDTILANQSYATDYHIGDTKMLDLGTEGKHLMEIVAFDTDDRADDTGKAGITWISKDLLNTKKPMNNGVEAYYRWDRSDLKTYLAETIKSLIPTNVRSSIVPVKKITSIYYNNTFYQNGVTTQDDLWIPSYREIFGDQVYEQKGETYNLSSDSRIKKFIGIANNWIIRTSDKTGAKTMCINSSGNVIKGLSQLEPLGIALGFCTN